MQMDVSHVEQENVMKPVINVVNEVNRELLCLIVLMDQTACNERYFD